jgi:hypothetical protein
MALFGSVVSSDAQGDFGFRNKIINGNFNVWQRGTSFTSSSVNEYSADRFRTEGYAHNSVISRQTFTVGQTDVPGYPTYFCRIASSTTVSAGQYWAVQQRVEAPQVMSGSGTYTLSFWVKSTTSVAAGAFTYGIDGRQGTSPALSTTWQKLTTTVSISNSESTGYVSIYLVYFDPTKGNITVDIANVQLEYGSQATPFERRPVGTELQLCQRYYYRATSAGTSRIFGSGYVNSTTVADYFLPFPVTMRDDPSALEQTGTAANYAVLTATGAVTCSAVPTNIVNSQWGASFRFTVASGLTTGQAVLARATAAAAYLGWSAEL